MQNPDVDWSSFHDTPVRRMLNTLRPGEKRAHVREIEPTGREGRFWEVALGGGIDGASMRWRNNALRPSVDPGLEPWVAMTDLPKPVFDASNEESRLGDFYHVSAFLYLFAEPIVKCLRMLDPDSIEAIETHVEPTDICAIFFLTRIVRQLDAVDVARTSLTLHNKRILPDRDVYGKRVYFPDGMVVRDDVPAEVHCFADVYSGRLFFSSELVTCARAGGAGYFAARHPTGLRSFSPTP